MSLSRYLVDTNVILRFLSGQPAAQAQAAQKLFARAVYGEIILDVSPVIVAEAFYTLTSYYGVDRKTAAEKISLLLQQHGIRIREENSILAALQCLQTTNVGFADAFLASAAAEENLAIASFDRDFDKMKVERYEPPS